MREGRRKSEGITITRRIVGTQQIGFFFSLGSYMLERDEAILMLCFNICTNVEITEETIVL